MELTVENKAYIDSLTIYSLLKRWRFSPSGDLWLEGETGDYWGKRMTELRDAPGGNEEWVTASKTMGWGD